MKCAVGAYIPLYKGYFDCGGILKGTFCVLHLSGEFSNELALLRKAVLRVTICNCLCFLLRWYWFTDVMKEGKLCEQIRQLKASLINAVLLVSLQ